MRAIKTILFFFMFLFIILVFSVSTTAEAMWETEEIVAVTGEQLFTIRKSVITDDFNGLDIEFACVVRNEERKVLFIVRKTSDLENPFEKRNMIIYASPVAYKFDEKAKILTYFEMGEQHIIGTAEKAFLQNFLTSEEVNLTFSYQNGKRDTVTVAMSNLRNQYEEFFVPRGCFLPPLKLEGRTE